MDEFGYQSQMRACDAVQSGRYKDEIVPLEIQEQSYNPQTGKYETKTVIFDTDEGIRRKQRWKAWPN